MFINLVCDVTVDINAPSIGYGKLLITSLRSMERVLLILKSITLIVQFYIVLIAKSRLNLTIKCSEIIRIILSIDQNQLELS